MIVPPWLVLLAVVALALALIYQLLARNYGWRVIVYWVIILVGILATEAAAESFGWDVARVGDLRTLADLAGGVAITTVLWFLRV